MTTNTPDELAWVHIRIASDAVYKLTNALGVREQLVRSAADGMLRSRAARVTKMDGSDPIIDFGELPETFWAGSLEFLWRNSLRAPNLWLGGNDWNAGVVEGILTADGGTGEEMHVKAHGVEFCGQDLIKVFGLAKQVANELLGVGEPVTPTHPTIEPENRAGGRPSSKHGEPIATTTISLLKLSPEALARETGDTVQESLRAEYQRVGVSSPAGNNLEGIAQGVLRAVRREKQSQTPSN